MEKARGSIAIVQRILLSPKHLFPTDNTFAANGID
jgi:hypothetical protein